MDGPISPSLHGYLAVVLLVLGFALMSIVLSISPKTNSFVLVMMQFLFAGLSSLCLGFGTVFTFLAGGVYV